MSDHAWAQEQIAAYVAGGLDAPEAERLEAHARDCADCTAAIADARTLDRGLDALFGPVKPAPALEDRMVRSLHVIKAEDLARRRWRRNLIWSVAASVGLGSIGAAGTSLVREGALELPWHELADSSRKYRESEVLEIQPVQIDSSESMPTGGMGFGYGRHPGIVQFAERDGSVRNRPGSGGAGFGPGSMGLTPVPGLAGGAPGPDVGLDPKSTASYNIDRIEDSKVPGPVSADEGVDKKKKLADEWGYLLEKERSGKAVHRFVPGDYRSRPDAYSPQWAEGSGKASGGNQQDQNKGNNSGSGKVEPKPNAPPEPQAESVASRRIIRSGDIEFEIESFDSAQASVIKIVGAIKGGYIATVNSEKLANGKVKGSILVRVPPEALDTFVLDLRRELGKGGELKGLRIGSQDITKQYTDLESRLKAARTMQERLLQIIKDGKGEIKQLLEAEKELGVWRTKIEEMEGERRYFDSQVSLSTLTITLAEKEIKAAAGITESERVDTGIEVEDVEKAQQQLLAAIAEAKGRVTKSELKQPFPGQLNATVNFEVAPEQAGALRDRLRQLGAMARLQIDRIQQAEGGKPQKDVKVTRGDTQFLAQLYNIAGITARETATIGLASTDVATAYRTLHDAVLRAKGRVQRANLDEHDRLNITAQLDFEVRRADEAAIQTAFAAAGEVISRTVSRTPEDDKFTDAKVQYRATFTSADRLPPRETTTLTLEVADVDQAAATFTAQVGEAKGRVVKSDVSHERNGHISAHLAYDVPLAAAASLAERFKAAGTFRVQTARDPQAPDGKLALARIDVTLSNTELIVPRDDGVWPQVKKGLSWSANVLLVSVSWLIVGLCVVLPWGLAGYGAYRVVRRLSRPPGSIPTPPASPSP